jgi:hypothetical protein
MNDGFSVDVIEVTEDPRFEFILGRDSNAAKHGLSVVAKTHSFAVTGPTTIKASECVVSEPNCAR